jgi:hypothetical protein
MKHFHEGCMIAASLLGTFGMGGMSIFTMSRHVASCALNPRRGQ